uniref:Vitamin K-dependent protein C n=1 Tax=Pygocentrus nattereri TaxID=42514 RepID=A0AAR2M554_PYGNA
IFMMSPFTNLLKFSPDQNIHVGCMYWLVLWMSVCECRAAMYGHVQSPLFPEPYLADLYIRWYLKVPHGYQIQLTFNYLDIEPSVNCTKDSLTVLHGSEILGKFCGQKSTDKHHPGNKPIMSPDNCLWLFFETDSSNQGSQMHLGFFVFYQAVGMLVFYIALDVWCVCVCVSVTSVCGRPTVDLSKRDRVLGGKTAPAGSFPWQVFLLSGGRGGTSIIGDRWLMTAAHNLENQSNVYVGDNHISGLVKSPSLANASLHVHPGYKNNNLRTNFDNDIALIKLNSPITFNMNVMPVCLPERDTELSGTGLVSGFGLTEDSLTADTLRYIRLPVVEQDKCHRSIETERKNRHDVAPLTDNMFCAGLPEGGKDTCSGDSGLAFVMKDDETYWVAGIVSWGVDCGQPGKYGIYTRVAKYLNWIQKTMDENQ